MLNDIEYDETNRTLAKLKKYDEEDGFKSIAVRK